jgi:hypothetical protein
MKTRRPRDFWAEKLRLFLRPKPVLPERSSRERTFVNNLIAAYAACDNYMLASGTAANVTCLSRSITDSCWYVRVPEGNRETELNGE